ncbi:hypothetical protein [Tumidithrix helvetica]
MYDFEIKVNLALQTFSAIAQSEIDDWDSSSLTRSNLSSFCHG